MDQAQWRACGSRSCFGYTWHAVRRMRYSEEVKKGEFIGEARANMPPWRLEWCGVRAFRTLLAIALFCPSCGGATRPALALAQRTLGCGAVGYTMQVPADWTIATACARRGSARAPGDRIVLITTIERHSFWSESRSHSSIRNDIAAAGTNRVLLAPPQYTTVSIAGRRFYKGWARVLEHDGTRHTVAEMETFLARYMYKFAASVGGPASDLREVDRIWAGILFHPTTIVPSRLASLSPTPARPHTPATPAATRMVATSSATIAGPAQPTATATTVPVSSFAINAVIVPSTIRHGETATLSAVTAPGAVCSAVVVYSTGSSPGSFDGHGQTVPASGRVSWSWRPDTNARGGTATVACAYRGVKAQASTFFTIVG